MNPLISGDRDRKLKTTGVVSAATLRQGFFDRYAVLVLAIFVIATPVLVYSAGRAVGTNSNRLSDWLPANLEETVALEKFNAWFGDGHFVVVSWDDCKIDLTTDPADNSGDDPRLARLLNMLVPTPVVAKERLEMSEHSLEVSGRQRIDRWVAEFENDLVKNEVEASPSLEGAPSQVDCELYFKKVITSRTLLQTLTAEPHGVPKAEAVRRLMGSVIGREGQACAIVFLQDHSIDHLRAAIGFRRSRWIDRNVPQGVLYRALQACDVPLNIAHLGGPPIDNLSINEEGQRTLARLGLAAGALGLVLAWWSLRSVMLTLIVFYCGIISTCGATAAIWLTGCHADAIVLAMPSLIYVLTISGAIHLINYYRKAVQIDGIVGAAGRAIKMGFRPAALCNITTALGLLSLFSSDLTPIRRFGMFSALGMVLMLIVLFLLLPAALELFGKRTAFGLTCKVKEIDLDQAGDGRGSRMISRWARWLIRHHRLVCISSLLVLVGLGGGVGKIHTSVDLLKLFDSETRILSDYRWLENNLGNLVPLEVLVRFPADTLETPGAEKRDGQLKMIQRVEVVDRIRTQIDYRFGDAGEQLISPAMSGIAFMPKLPREQRSTSSVMQRTVLNKKLYQSRNALADSGYLKIDPVTGDELWRISLRVAAFKNVDFGRMAEDVRRLVDPLLQQANEKLVATGDVKQASAISAIHTGAIPIVYKAQRELLTSLIASTIWSFATITPLLMYVTGGFSAGLIAMIPNLLPVIAVFGAMGWLDIPVDIGCMMTASIALGVAVDDTIHFLCWYQQGQDHATNRNGAIEAAFQSCCVPTLQASVINGLGLSVFLLSTFVPTKQFGLLMLVILTCGAIAELVLLPAILASPLGKAFDMKTTPKSPSISRFVVRLPHYRLSPLKRKKVLN